MGAQDDIKDALNSGRDDLVRVLAEHRIRPTVLEESGDSSLAGLSTAPSFGFETESGESAVTDRQTRSAAVDALGITSEDECEDVREEIENHAAWGE